MQIPLVNISCSAVRNYVDPNLNRISHNCNSTETLITSTTTEPKTVHHNRSINPNLPYTQRHHTNSNGPSFGRSLPSWQKTLSDYERLAIAIEQSCSVWLRSHATVGSDYEDITSARQHRAAYSTVIWGGVDAIMRSNEQHTRSIHDTRYVWLAIFPPGLPTRLVLSVFQVAVK